MTCSVGWLSRYLPDNPFHPTIMEGAVHRFRVHRNNSKPERITRQGKPTNANSRRSSVPACRRCRQHKKRCSRTADGSCEQCQVAWVPCSLMEESVSPHMLERELRSRIDWLSRLVNDALPVGRSPIESVETGRDMALGSPIQSPPAEATIEIDCNESGFEESRTPKPEENVCLSVTASRKCLQAYFRHVHRSYPFMDSEFVLQDFDALCNKEACNNLLPQSAVPNRLYMIMAIGFTTLQRAGEVQNIEERDLQPCLKGVLCECVSRVDEQSAGTLLLLGLYLLFKPGDQDPRAIAGVLINHALAVGLMSESPSCQILSPRALELRRRLGWSVYVFTRMISISYGLPFAFPDNIMKVPLPSIMIHEYGSEEGHQYAIALQVSRHMISLRQLETRIINGIYDPNPGTSPQELRLQIEDWYTQGCLLSSSTLCEPDQLPFHTTITWLNVRYQNLLLLLYTPARGDFATEENLPNLQGAAQQYIRLSLILHDHRHLPMNWITLCRLLSLAAIFLYCTRQWAPAFDDIPEIPLLATLLEFFPSSWGAAHEASRILRRLADIITKQNSPLIARSQLSGSSVIDTPGLDTEMRLQSVRDELEALLSQTMGEASFYIWPLRSKVAERRVSHQPFTMDGLIAGLENGVPSNRVSVVHDGTLTPAENDMGESLLDTQWTNLWVM